ncbi:MAG: potassium transporter Kup [Puniceicoccales bacterium]|jgi:KUP system potassium uptake protein|nr:potassium transporter Kup [Puniceicoccales bacterium]
MQNKRTDTKYTLGLSLGALGVVFGDIGTSPLYAMKECYAESHIMPTPENILGILSLIIWTLAVIVTGKYVLLVMRADHKGEGGIMALVSLAFFKEKKSSSLRTVLVLLGVFGAALLYGDGMITPAISVLSAVEGLQEVNSGLSPWILPITVSILVALFAVQKIGTGKVGKIFGPVMLLWFLTLGAMGVYGLCVHTWKPLLAFSPYYAIQFLTTHPLMESLPVMGAVFLAVTGAEALYADMGHFGLKPIRWAWCFLAMPMLVLNYLGQGALLLAAPEGRVAEMAAHPFFKLAPAPLILPLVILATLATVIASQALITGTYSITMQAIQLGFLPRLKIAHTSRMERGQIYMAPVNWFLMVCCVGLVLAFQSSGNLAAAYGIAVTMTMLITTILFFFVMKDIWKWSAWKCVAICVPFACIELVFFFSNALKVGHGGWFPILVGLGIFVLMTTWRRGRHVLHERLKTTFLPLDLFLADLKQSNIHRVPGTAIFMSGNANVTPLALLHNLKHNRVLHKRVIILSILTEAVPHIDSEERASIVDLGDGFYKILGHYGYMEEPDVMEVLSVSEKCGFKCNINEITFFLSRETIIHAEKPAMPIWREKIFALLNRNALPATAFFKLPPNRVVELGMQIEI